MRRLIAFAALLILWAPPGAASDWRLAPAGSEITFVYVENDRPKAARFRDFDGRARFDPAQPETAEMSMRVEASSIDMGNPFLNTIARSIDWLDAATYPEMSFRLDRLTALEDGRYQAEGTLSVKGRDVVITPIVELVDVPEGLRARGRFVFDRRDYRIGIGFTSLFTRIEDEVALSFDLLGAPATAQE
ncbi:MAG: YceI family protein [Pseudomonadota bacterium]